MSRIEKTVFISYRRSDVYTALAVYENLKNQGYDVFFDYRSISSGDFEQIIQSNIRARAHFLLILTHNALDRCNEPGDWLRREIELAIDEKRNIIPLFFKGFRFGNPSVSEQLTGKLKNLSRYNGLNVHEDYFDEAMHRLRLQYLNIPLDTVLHPVSTEVRKVVREEQLAADKALAQIEDVKELVKHVDEESVPIDAEPSSEQEIPKPIINVSTLSQDTENDFGISSNVPDKSERAMPTIAKEFVGLSRAAKKRILSFTPSLRLLGRTFVVMVLLAFLIWGGVNALQRWSAPTSEPTFNAVNSAIETSQPLKTATSSSTQTSQQSATITPSPTQTSLPATPEPGIGSTQEGKDGMTLLFVPAGKFTKGSIYNAKKIDLEAFWIDRTEVTNEMYANCMRAGVCQAPKNTNRINNSNYKDFPIVYVTWSDANTYCTWAERLLPTDSQWEKAARGTDGRPYPWGNKEPNDSLLNYGYGGNTTKVGSYLQGASPYGALDLAGNAWEWVADQPSEGSGIVRGGSYLNQFNNVIYVIAAYESSPMDTTASSSSVGFRCAMDAIP